MFIHKYLSRSLRYALMAIASLTLSFGAIWAQNVKVTGTVTDKSGEPLVGVYVLVQGTKTGATTDVNGKYSINAPANGRLVFTSMGFTDLVEAINNRSIINAVMQIDAVQLSDVVVVGYGQQKKENLTGAVAAVDVKKTLEARPIADVSRGLQGVVPGLTIQVGSGEVGADAVMRIRGHVSSYVSNSAAPLILLDNVEIPNINLVNPDDIEKISVLKDAASASIYGAKGAFGVILITTKKGANTDKVELSYSGNFAFQNMSKKFRMADVDGLRYTVEAAERIGVTTPVGAFWLIDRAGYNAAVAWKEKYGKTVGANDPMVYGRDWYVDASNRKIGVRTYDPYDYLIREWAPSQNHNVTINGKSGKTTYNVSAAYLGQNGMMKTAKHDDFRRWNLSARVNTEINKYLQVHAGLMYSKNEKRNPYATSSTTADIWYYMYRWGPTYPMVKYDETGSPLRNATYETSAANTASRVNNYTSANIGFTITPLKDWKINLDYTYTNNDYSYRAPGYKFTAANTWGAGIKTGSTIANEWDAFNKLGATISQYQLNNYQYTSDGSNPDHIIRTTSNSARNTFNGTTTYDLKLFEDHTFNFMLGLNAVKYDHEFSTSQKTNLIDINNPQFSLATGTQTVDGYQSWESQLGFFGRVNYNYKERYLLEANLRYDGTSKFPSGLQWRWYPSFSAGWRVMEEPWMNWAKEIVSSLKIRGSWGKIGDQTVSNSLYVPIMGSNQINWIGTTGEKVTAYGTPASVSANVTWQDIVSLDFGFDIRFLKGDLGLTFDWYQRDTKNMLVPREGLSYTYGTTAPYGNFGSLRTKGFEIGVDYGHTFGNGLTIMASASLADGLTKVTKFGTTRRLSDWYVGKTIGEIWGYQTDRLYNKSDFVYDASGNFITITSADGYKVYQTIDGITQGKLQNSSNFKFGPGDVKFKDLDGNGYIDNGKQTYEDHGDLKKIGNTTPRYEYSFKLAANWKGFDFSAFFQGVGKRSLWGNSGLTIPGFNSSDGAMAQAIAGNFWIEGENENAFYPRAYNNGNSNSANNMQIQTRYLLNMAYLRLKNLTLGYTLPDNLTKKALISKVRVYMSLENIFTWDHLKGLPIDPEEIAGYSIYNSSNYNSSRTGVGVPTFKTVSFGVQVNF